MSRTAAVRGTPGVLLATFLLVCLSWVWLAAPARALDCAEMPPAAQVIPEAPLVMVGDVVTSTRTAENLTIATVDVVEIWKGRDLPPQVGITSGNTDFGDAGREWTIGGRYLFFPEEDGATLTDGLCWHALEWEASFDDLRPADARAVAAAAGSTPGDGSTAWWLIAGAAGAAATVILSAVTVARLMRRRRTAP